MALITKYRITKYGDHVNDIRFPVVQNGQCGKIKKQNAINVNVFGYEDKQPFPIYISRDGNDDDDVLNLLLITEGEKQHCAC